MIEAQPGPLLRYGNRNPAGYGASSPGANSDLGPGATIGEIGLLDPRVGYNVTRKGFIGFGMGYRRVLSQVPSAIATANIAALAHVVNGTPMTLVSATGSGITVVGTSGFTAFANNNQLIPAGACAIDGLPSLTSFGSPDSNGEYKVNFYNAGSMISRAVSITGVTAGAGGNFIVAGYDWYGYPMTQLITVAAGVNTVNSLKAFKFVVSVTPQFTDAHNYSVGTADVYGFPIQAGFFHDTLIWWNETLITANTGFVVPDVTNPATNATGDVRGTYATQSASDGTKRLTIAQSAQLGGCVTVNGATSLFGISQV